MPHIFQMGAQFKQSHGSDIGFRIHLHRSFLKIFFLAPIFESWLPTSSSGSQVKSSGSRCQILLRHCCSSAIFHSFSQKSAGIIAVGKHLNRHDAVQICSRSVFQNFGNIVTPRKNKLKSGSDRFSTRSHSSECDPSFRCPGLCFCRHILPKLDRTLLLVMHGSKFEPVRNSNKMKLHDFLRSF